MEKKFRLNSEFTSVILESFKKGGYFKNSVPILPSLRIAQNIELYAGISLNYLNTNISEGINLTEKYIHSWNGSDCNNFQGIYAGYKGGINFVF